MSQNESIFTFNQLKNFAFNAFLYFYLSLGIQRLFQLGFYSSWWQLGYHYNFSRLPLSFLTWHLKQFYSATKDNSASSFNFQLSILTHVDFYFTMLLHYLGLMYDTSLWVSAPKAHFVLSWMGYDLLTFWVKWSFHWMYLVHSFSTMFSSCLFWCVLQLFLFLYLL